MPDQNKKLGRPPIPTEKRKVKPNVTIDPELIELAKDSAAQIGISYSRFVEQAIENEVVRTKRELAKQPLKIISPPPDHMSHPECEFWIPLRGGVAAGERISSDILEYEVDCEKAYPPDHYALRVFGRSMEPTVHHGDNIVVREWRDLGLPKKGTLVVYSDGGGVTLKELDYRKAVADEESNSFGQVPVLKSINKKFKDVEPMDGGRIVAIFVESL